MHNLTATATDDAANTSVASAALPITIDISTVAPGQPDLNMASDDGISNTDDITTVTTPDIDGAGAEANSAVELFTDNPTPGTSVGTTTANGSGGWTITTSTLAEGVHNLTAVYTDVAGNGPSAASTALTIDVDNTAPVILSIVRADPNPQATGAPFNYTVTFDDFVQGVASNNFSLGINTAIANPPGVPTTADNITWNVPITGTTTTGQVRLDLDLMLANIINATNIALATPRNGDETYDIVTPAPTELPTGFMATVIDGTTVQLDFINAMAGVIVPEEYLIVGLKNGALFTPANNVIYTTLGVPVDDPAEDTVYLVVDHNPPGDGIPQTVFFTNLQSGASYTFEIYPYTNAGAFPQYNVSAPMTQGPLVPPVGAATTVVAGLASPLFLPALTTELTGAVPPQLDAIVNFEFVVRDDDLQPLPVGDNIPTLIDQVVINRDIINDAIGDWTNAIDVMDAELSSGGNSLLGVVGANTITFSSIPTGGGQLGEVPDNTAKTYQLRIWLRVNLLGGLTETIDGRDFVFQVSHGAPDILITGNSSQFAGGTTVSSGNGANIVAVTRDNFLFTTQPDASVGVLADLATPPVIRAQDANGNLDLSAFNLVTTVGVPPAAPGFVLIRNTDGIPVNNLPFQFIAGVLTFPFNFQYTNVGTVLF